MVAGNVVLLHGQPGDGSDWAAVIAHLPDHVSALADDRPGYGASPCPPGGFEHNARAVLHRMDEAGMDSAVVAGHSYGGGVALALAALAPERVESLALIASVGPRCLDGWDRLLAAPLSGPVCALSAWWLTPRFARLRLNRIERRLGRQLRPDEHPYWAIWAGARHEHGAVWRTFLHEQRELVGNLDALDRYVDRVDAPTVVLADPADRMISIETSEALAARIPDARLRLADGGGHHLPRRRPDLVADAIRDLLTAPV